MRSGANAFCCTMSYTVSAKASPGGGEGLFDDVGSCEAHPDTGRGLQDTMRTEV